MADNIIVTTGSVAVNGATVATDQDPVGGAHYQLIKLVGGTADTFNLVDAKNAAPAGTEYGLIVRNIPFGTQTVQFISGTVTSSLATNSALKVADIGTRTVTGSYFCGTPLITGSATIQVLTTLENPFTSSRNLYLKRIEIQGTVNAVSTIQFLYRLGRTSSGTMPSGSSQLILQSQKHASADANPSGFVRYASGTIAPSCSFALGDAWSSSPGVFQTAAGQFVPYILTFSAGERETSDIVIAPGEGIAIRADPNTTGWKHSVDFFWDEGIG
jgi:hypothetical protein